MRILIAFVFLFFSAIFAEAQSPVTTQPYAVTTYNNSSTISVTDTFQSIWAANTGTRGRAGCQVENAGTNPMYVYFGPIASATKNTSIKLTAGQFAYCNFGGIALQDQVSITGTSGEAFYAAQQ